MKYQVLFSLKNNEKIFKTVVCCSRDWHLRVKITELQIRWCFGDDSEVIFLISQRKHVMTLLRGHKVCFPGVI